MQDRTTEGQPFRRAGLNLLAAIIICGNTRHLGQAVTGRRRAGLDCAPDLLAHVSPLGWAQILSPAKKGGAKGLGVGYCTPRQQAPGWVSGR
jgi:hypothetical protein